MWKNKNETPAKDGDYPAVIHPTFQREKGVDLGTFREILRFRDGYWLTSSYHTLESFQWEVVAWFDVPEYKEI
jgi:hypothetical protein